MADRITTARAFKRKHAAFPLTIHAAAGRWCKKHKGRTFYFGKLTDPRAARKRYEQEWEYVVEGKIPPATPGGAALTMRQLCNAFNASKANLLAAGQNVIDDSRLVAVADFVRHWLFGSQRTEGDEGGRRGHPNRRRHPEGTRPPERRKWIRCRLCPQPA